MDCMKNNGSRNIDDDIYTIELSGKELGLIRDALDQWGRLQIGQCDELVDMLALDGKDIHEVYGNADYFDSYIARKIEAKKYIEMGLRIAMPENEYRNTSDSGLAFDLMTFIRHTLYIDHGGNPNAFNVCAYEPRMIFTNEFKPKISKVEKKG